MKKPFDFLIKSCIVLSLLCSSLAWAEQSQPIKQQPPHFKPIKIQLAILLDTSNSMDGLIEQARNQLWQIVNEFSKAKKYGQSPILEVAVYEYGNSHLAKQSGYVRRLVDFTRELDKVSESLFSLTTSGGDEYCGYAINTAVNGLSWSSSHDDLKAIFIAGNEPFSQGPVSYKKAILNANSQDISVNTIYAGDYDKGIQLGWQQAVMLAGGNYMNIDHNQQIAHIDAPQDVHIAKLNQQLNQTYIPYGQKGLEGESRQQEQDKLNAEISTGLLAKRVRSKASKFYDNESWDLVDAVKSGKLKVNLVEENNLPENMQKMKKEEREVYIKQKIEQRKEIQQQILNLTKERELFVQKEKQKSSHQAADTLDDAMISSIKQHAKKKAFVFEK